MLTCRRPRKNTILCDDNQYAFSCREYALHAYTPALWLCCGRPMVNEVMTFWVPWVTPRALMVAMCASYKSDSQIVHFRGSPFSRCL